MMMSRTFAVAVIAVIATAALTVTADSDRCTAYGDSCSDCLSHVDCGWCSQDVVYKDGSKGSRCAGLSPTGGQSKWKCEGLYSVGTCQAGYKCNKTEFSCYQAPPGHGGRQEQCEANCTNHGTVYGCNHTSKQCYPVAPGTPGSSALAPCEASCIHVTSHPSSSSPSPAVPAQTYVCNHTTWKCENATVGHGAGKSVCESSCVHHNSTDTQYYCDSITHTCLPTANGQPGEKKALCEETCELHPNPGPPPQFSGLWRGVAIENGYKVGEWDMDFTQTSATIIDVYSAVTIKGTPFNVINGDSLDLWIKVTSGPGVGQTIKAIGTAEQERGPETEFLTAAFAAPGAAAPTGLAAAMTAGAGTKVFYLSKCAGTPECLFILPSTGLIESRLAQLLALGKSIVESATTTTETEDVYQADVSELANGGKRITDSAKVAVATAADHCSLFNASCTDCTAHNLCGWCSQDVTYKNGATGTHCAGFNPDPHATQNFTCKGQFSNYGCDVGYKCNQQNFTCDIDPTPGNGHTKEVCEALCRPTPAPTKVSEYTCNMTTKKCHKCPEQFCAGAMPKAGCEAACIKPHKGPSKSVAGMWRGVQINENYPLGEIEFVFNASKVAMYKNNKVTWSGTMESYGGDVMVFEVDGKKVPAIYSIADQHDGFYQIMTIAFGLPDGLIPQGFGAPMATKGMYEQVLAKCTTSPCVFDFPANMP